MARLTELLSGVDLPSLAGKALMTENRLAAIASGAEPTLGEVRRIANALKLPLSSFVSSDASAQPSRAELLFRGATQPGKTEIAAQRIAARVDASMSLASNTDANGTPWWWSSFEIGGDTALEAERNAATFRRLLYGDDQLGPLLTLPTVVTDRMSGPIPSQSEIWGLPG